MSFMIAVYFGVTLLVPSCAFVPTVHSKRSVSNFGYLPYTQGQRLSAELTEINNERSDAPGPILSNVEGTWAYDTMSRRVHEDILPRIYAENNVHNDPAMSDAKQELDKLLNELRNAAKTPLSHLPDKDAPDYPTWHRIMEPYVQKGTSWLDAPWLVTEFYLYRRICSAFKYFETGYDPFSAEKRSGLASSETTTEALAKTVLPLLLAIEKKDKDKDANKNNNNKNKDKDGVASAGAGPSREEEEEKEQVESVLKLFVFVSLWGNRMDLSLWADGGLSRDSSAFLSLVLQTGEEHLLANQMGPLLHHLLGLREGNGKEQRERRGRVDLVVDNAGFELITDLMLADCLLATKTTDKVVLRLKGHPTFVSDALVGDVEGVVSSFQGKDPALAPTTRKMGERWGRYLQTGQLVLSPHNYWCQPFAYWCMDDSDNDSDSDNGGETSTSIYDALSTLSDLTIVKGDANYRRLLGEKDWPLDQSKASFDRVVGSYFPSPVLALRTLKAELGCGMEEAKVSAAMARDGEDWMVSGKYGVVQFALGAKYEEQMQQQQQHQQQQQQQQQEKQEQEEGVLKITQEGGKEREEGDNASSAAASAAPEEGGSSATEGKESNAGVNGGGLSDDDFMMKLLLDK